MFELTAQPIDSAALRARLERPDAGACVVFEGWVRNHHAGKPVTKLEYEAFDEMARLEGAAITSEAEQEHPGCTVLCVHRTGSLPVGELAVWIGVALYVLMMVRVWRAARRAWQDNQLPAVDRAHATATGRARAHADVAGMASVGATAAPVARGACAHAANSGAEFGRRGGGSFGGSARGGEGHRPAL